MMTGVRTAAVVATQGLRARPLRSALAVLSLFVGVLAITVVQASSTVAERAVVSQAERSSGHAPTYTASFSPGDVRTVAELETLTRGTDAVAVVTAQGALGDTRDVHDGAHLGLELMAMDGDIRTIRPFRVLAGEWLTFADQPTLAPRLVLNESAAELLTDREVHAELRIGEDGPAPTPRVLGVVDDGDGQPIAYTRLDEALRWSPALLERAGVTVTVHDPGSRQRTTMAARIGAMELGGDVTFARTDTVEQQADSLALVRTLFTVLAGVAVVVGTLGILNIGLATVRERVDELALRRAVGAGRGHLAGIVLAEALLVGAVAAAAAILVSLLATGLATDLLYRGMPDGAGLAFPGAAVLLGTGVSLGAALLGAAVPAWQAARIPIARVMRA
ncbi:ABC transporter permease [Haloechinothrix sp. LS1_15]|uniref:ABC transporter permease n=1 Tax=Haloechinothrix sp. LS1_15 TaxID=2652248 RepID=UPI0029451501|nr:ABC transporter permease [Haloechinothrix sp. LS1_15]MDV6013224.1 ABC transporter permease [Haloechinothrix sp. LS1_15]